MARFLLGRITLLFFILLTAGVGGVLAYQAWYVTPAKKCEASGGWWAAPWHGCATPIDVRHLPRLQEAPAQAAPAPTAAAPKP